MTVSLITLILAVETVALDTIGQFGKIEDSLLSLAIYHSSSCSHNALLEYMELCSEIGFDLVDPQLRLRLAVKLSICEFEEASVEFPNKCKHLDTASEYISCVKEFRRIPQLWTSYSGNYRKLRTLCYEELLPHAKNHIVELFANITKIYSSFYETMARSQEKMAAGNDVLASKLQALQEMMDETLIRYHEHFSSFSEDSEKHSGIMKANYEMVESLLRSQASHVFQQTDELRTELNNVKLKAEDLGTSFDVISNGFQQRESQLVATQESEYRVLAENVHALANFIGDTSHFVRILAGQLGQVAHQNLEQHSQILENHQRLQETFFLVDTIKLMFGGFRSQMGQGMAQMESQMDDMGNSFRTTNSLVEGHFAHLSNLTANLSQNLDSLYEQFGAVSSLLIFGVLHIIARWGADVLTTVAVGFSLMVVLWMATKVEKLARLGHGLLLGLAVGLFLRLAHWKFFHVLD